jgi:hypothetical protein
MTTTPNATLTGSLGYKYIPVAAAVLRFFPPRDDMGGKELSAEVETRRPNGAAAVCKRLEPGRG